MHKQAIFRILTFILLAGAAALAYFYWWLPQQAGVDREEPAQPAANFTTAAVQKGTLTGRIGTTGVVRSRQSATLVWQTSGTVEGVTASVGETVPAKAVLAQLEQTSLPQAVILARAEQVTAQKNLDTLLSSTQIRANTQLALIRAQKALDDALEDRDSKLYQRASSETIDIARANLINANEALDQAEAFFDSHSGDTESLTYATALSRLAKARQDQTRAEYNLNYVQGLPDPLDIEEADALITVAQANMLQAKLDWERVKDGPNQDDVAAAEARVAAAQAAINLAQISAPFSGTLTLANTKPGDQVTPGTLAFTLDDLSHLYIDVAVAEIDIPRVQVGQTVSIGFEALPDGPYKGVVTEVGAVGKAVGGTVNFTVTVEISAPDGAIRPGMTAVVSIVVSEAQDVLLVPTRAIRSQNGQRVIYLLDGDAPVPVAVRTGITSGDLTSIAAGAVSEGSLVITNPSAVR